MMTTLARLLVALPLVLVSAQTSVAQGTLPLDLAYAPEAQKYPVRFQLAGIGTGSDLRVWLRYSNQGENKLIIEYRFRYENTSGSSKIVEHTLSYAPTALCAKASTTDAFFVAGYSETADAVLVEEWRMTSAALGGYVPPEETQAHSFLTQPTFTKSIVFIDRQTVLPLVSLAYNQPANALWLLEHASPHRVWELRMSTGAIAELYNSTGIAALGTMRHIQARKHLAQGFYLIFDQRPHGVGTIPTGAVVFAANDIDSDGVVDSEGVLPPSTFWSITGGPADAASWDLDYGIPP